MALKATIFKAELTISDMDRHHYGSHALTIARHPSETDERMMVRLFAFARHADEALQFTKGLSTEDEPDLWQKSLTGDIDLWIDVGLPDEKRIRKACNRSRQVVIYAYGGRTVDIWWEGIHDNLTRFGNLQVFKLDKDTSEALAAMAERTMRITATLSEGSAWFNDEQHAVTIEPVRLSGDDHAQ